MALLLLLHVCVAEYSMVTHRGTAPSSRVPAVSIKPMTAEQLAAGIFALYPITQQNKVVDDQAWADLQLNLFIERNRRTITSFGAFGLREILQPTTEMGVIAARQATIQTLSTNAAFRNQVCQELAKIERSCKSLFDYWQPQILPLHYAVQGYYFDTKLTKRLNTSVNSLEIANLLELSTAIKSIAMAFVAEGFQRYLSTSYLNGRLQNPLDIVRYGWENIKAHHSLARSVPMNDLVQPLRDAVTHHNDERAMLHIVTDAVPRIANHMSRQTLRDTYEMQKLLVGAPLAGFFTASGLIVADYGRIVAVRDAAKFLRANLHNMHLLQHALVDVAQFVQSARKISMILDRCCLSPSEPQLVLRQFFAQARYDKDLTELLVLLQSPTLSAQGGWYNFRRGVVLRAHKLLQENKAKLVHIIRAVAQIDALCSMSVLINEHQHGTTKLSFVGFTMHETPILHCNNLWVPLLPAQQAVTNNVALGAHKPTTMILTGPNGAGKSTIMKAVAYAIVLAQSVGIVPADSGAVMTPIDRIVTYKSPEEVIANNQSTFMAQKERAQELERVIESATGKQKMALFVDEPFVGTVAAEAEEQSRMFAIKTCNRSNVIGVFATHFEKPTQLETQYPSTFANYQLQLLQQKEGNKFIRTFKLLPGVATWWFHDEEMRRAFVEQL